MNNNFAFFGRGKEIDQLLSLYALHKRALIVGPAGIGKTALLRQVRQRCPVLVCEETSSLRRICDSVERQLGWTHYKLNVIERKNRLLAHLERRGEQVAFDHVALTPPRVARFMALLAEKIPIWIACRSDRAHEIGHIWQELYKFARVEISPLTAVETRALVEQAAAQGKIQEDARKHADELHRMSGGNPRILEELLIELAAREYRINSSFGLDLLSLDRRIHEIDLAVKAAAQEPAKR
jgi:SH3-like domain-containing protein